MAGALTPVQACIAAMLGQQIVAILWDDSGGIAGRVTLVRNDYCVIDSDGAELVVRYEQIHSVAPRDDEESTALLIPALLHDHKEASDG